MIRSVLLPLLLCTAVPAVAQPAVSSATQIDPAQMALARAIATKLVPTGSYQKLMASSLEPVMNGLIKQMTDVPIRTFLAASSIPPETVAKLNAASTHDVMQILDPAFDQRNHIVIGAISDAMVALMPKFEPELREGLAEAYARHYSKDQLAEIDHFFATPTGTLFAANSSSIMVDPAVLSRRQAAMPAMFSAMMDAVKQAQAKTAGLPKPKTIEDLTDADRARLAKLLGVDPAELKKAKKQ